MIYIITAALAALGATIQAATGFGFPIVMMALLPVFLPTGTAASVTAMLTPLLNIMVGWKYRKNINYKRLVFPMISFLIVNSVCIFIGQNAADSILKRVLGGFLIVLSGYFFFFSERIKIKANALTGTSAGIISGIMNGFFSMGGPPVVVYLVASTDDNKEYMGTLQFYFFLTSVITVITRIALGSINAEVALIGAPSVLLIVAGTLIGGILFKKMNSTVLKKSVYVVMLVTGAVMLILG